MRKEVQINKIYTDYINEGERTLFLTNPFVCSAVQIIKNPVIPAEETEYFSWINKKLETYGEVWGNIKTQEDIKERVETFRRLVLSIKDEGYLEKYVPELRVVNGKIYGELTAYREDDKYILIDGHHRLSVMIALGYTSAPLTICKNENITIPSQTE